MKTYMLLAAAVLAPMSAYAGAVGPVAPAAPVNEGARVELIKEIEATRTALLPLIEPLPQITVRYQPRLDDIKATVAAAQTSAVFAKAKKEFGDWKTIVLRELYGENQSSFADGETFPAFSARRLSEINFLLALRQQLAAQRLEARTKEILKASRRSFTPEGQWGPVFDNTAPSGAAVPPASGQNDGAVRAEAPRPAGDPARYEKIRALLLSKGVSRHIVDTAIAEGIRQKVDPMIVLSVINQESNFRKNAYNKGSGCTGLMQLDPATAADMGVRGDLYDAGTNIKAGVKYLNWIANSFFKMNLDMSDLSKVPAEKLKIVLASYNWGIGNVSRIIRKHGADALDRVAPKETRNYIAEIPSRISAWFASFV